MMGDRKDFPIIFTFAVATLLSCCQASSSSLPRVTRTSDAVIIDFPDVQMVYPGPVPLPTFNPYSTIYQQQPMFYNGWPTLNGLPSLTAGYSMRQGVQPTTTTTTTTPAPAPAPAPAIKCGRGPTRFPEHHPHRSLINERNRDETNAKKNSWPFMVFVLPLIFGVPCSGVLISDTKVLLAAQCLERMPLIYWSTIVVLTGVHSVSPTDAQMSRRVTRAVIHARYNAGNYANDIAILTLDMPVIFSKTVVPVCLPPASTDPDQYADQHAVTLGWGTTVGYPSATLGGMIREGSSVTALQQATVHMLSNSLCREEDYFGKYISDLNICVKSEEQQPCVSDVGSPLVVQSSPGTWTVIGIHSYGQGCGVSGLKTRVSAFRTWIDQYIN
ncbi:chymotrypsinogen A-like isoform X2 [Daphnia pulex]|uniref:chymotrypsinogen A-like isoform X2 n=1 Tax=Daphnia pulex TaxID=6669 RepID=UPI001EDF3441|nr:chymotrypsinogen A-like isoform X2 [Daphnia pulex]